MGLICKMGEYDVTVRPRKNQRSLIFVGARGCMREYNKNRKMKQKRKEEIDKRENEKTRKEKKRKREKRKI